MRQKIQMFILAAGFLSPAARAGNVYVESNRPDQNTILHFRLDDSGHLQKVGELATGGKGFVDPTLALGPFDSDQEVVLTPDHSFLLATNGGSNSISVFQVGDGGALTPVAGSPFDSHGSNPVSIGMAGNLVTVVNKHGDPAQMMDPSLPNYVSFTFDAGSGTLTYVPGSEQVVANGSSPSQALMAPAGNFVFGADFLGGLVDSFQLNSSGQLTHVSSLGIPPGVFINSTAPRLPLGMAAHPTLQKIYVGFPTVNAIGVFDYDNAGNLQFDNATLDTGNVICWLRINRAGTRLYAANTGDPSLSVYDLSLNASSPREIQKVMIPSLGGAYQFALSPDETKLVAVTQRYKASTPQGEGNELHTFAVHPDTGLLAPAEISDVKLSVPADVRPQGVAIY